MADAPAAVDETTEDQVTEEPTTAPEVDQVTADALLSAQDGVEGTLTPNSPEEEEDAPTETASDETDTGAADGAEDDAEEGEPADTAGQAVLPEAPQAATEKDEAGVYDSPTTQDPGEFKPADYSFEIKTTDGKTVTISSPEEIDAFAAKLDENPELVNASQYTQFNRKSVAMDTGIANDKAKFDTQKAEFDNQQELAKVQQESLQQWNNEINYLANGGELPAISDEMNNADWTNPEIAKDPAVAARLEIFKFMQSANDKRLAAGLEPMRSVIEAHNAMQLEALKKQQSDGVNRDKETRQKKGAMVGGSAPHNPSNNPSDSIVGTGGSLDDLVLEYMNQ